MKSIALTGNIFHPRPSPLSYPSRPFPHPVDLAARGGKSDRLLDLGEQPGGGRGGPCRRLLMRFGRLPGRLGEAGGNGVIPAEANEEGEPQSHHPDKGV